MPYTCDPSLNTECKKAGCGTVCRLTHHKAFAKRDESTVVDADFVTENIPETKTPLLSEAKENVKRKHISRKAGAAKKALHEDGAVLPVESVEEKAQVDTDA